ncbi:GNAT family N-acetyltransferase [Microlunatus speluncae]|uniref:GNAT family N-acetyltransferase n=1 Tax=Microlunatus speluncae TaxID=2594267 RepID=UPI001266161F|nr:GNAT family N-acetyltransferase [Microlunatus speluncae]
MAKYKPRRAMPPDDEDDPTPDRPQSPTTVVPEPVPAPSSATHRDPLPYLDPPPLPDSAFFGTDPDPGPTPEPVAGVASEPRVDQAAEAPVVARPAPPYEPRLDDTSTRILRVRKELDAEEDYQPQRRPKPDKKSQRVWRAGRATLILVSIASVLTVAALLVLATLLYLDQRPILLVVGLTVLAIALLMYIWRMAWHPRLVADGSRLIVHNPFSKREIDWADVTLILPGPNGMIIGTDRDQVEVWCVQKGRSAMKRGNRTRADQVAEELWWIWDSVDPPMTDEQLNLRIRRARPNEAQLLTRMERTANEHALAHVFPPKRFPYPVTDIARRWQRTLAERRVRVRILEIGDQPAAFIAYDHETVRHLGVLPRHTRRGYGTALLTFAEEDIFSSGSRQVQLWVLNENRAARAFYRTHGWVETEDRRRSEFPPKPDELRMIKVNQHGRPAPPAPAQPPAQPQDQPTGSDQPQPHDQPRPHDLQSQPE